jgi:hypothetical protein
VANQEDFPIFSGRSLNRLVNASGPHQGGSAVKLSRRAAVPGKQQRSAIKTPFAQFICQKSELARAAKYAVHKEYEAFVPVCQFIFCMVVQRACHFTHD